MRGFDPVSGALLDCHLEDSATALACGYTWVMVVPFLGKVLSLGGIDGTDTLFLPPYSEFANAASEDSIK